jgi:hypothetical protein
VKLPVVAAPLEAVAVQLTVVMPSGKVLPEVREHTGVIVAPAASLAETVYVTFAPLVLVASTTLFAGSTSVGGDRGGKMVTAKPRLAGLPAASVAVHATGVVPTTKVLPDAGTQLTSTLPSTISVALAANVTARPDGAVARLVMSAGTVIAGGVVSRTVTEIAFGGDVLPVASVAEQFTAVVPMTNVLPDAGAQSTATEPLTMSVALAE